jgi:hypothetical protein
MCLMAAFVPHRSNKYFHCDSVQRNYFELALYHHECISNRIGSGIRNCPRRRRRRARFGALPTLSVQDRAIIVLNDHRFWGYASGPSSSGNTLPSSIHGYAARRSALPRERFSPLAQSGHSIAEKDQSCHCPSMQQQQRRTNSRHLWARADFTSV